MEYTKGPWKAEYREGPKYRFDGWQVIEDTDFELSIAIMPETIGGIKDTEGRSPRQTANAHLIAAAPELLEACKYVVQYHKENDNGEGELFGLDFVTTCIAAINKAGGK